MYLYFGQKIGVTMYKLLRPWLFKLPPEVAHYMVLHLLAFLPQSFFPKVGTKNGIKAMGLNFPHRVGLAAGLDKNALYLDGLRKLHFAFIEVGTVTPKAQIGNLKPRLFRLIKEHALINRLGFNNHGIEAMVQALGRQTSKGIVGVNIGKNKDTSLDNAKDDYRTC